MRRSASQRQPRPKIVFSGQILRLGLAMLCGCAAGSPRTIPIAPGWARNSINTVIFRRHSVASFDQHQFAAWYDPQGLLMLARRPLSSTTWTIARTPYQGHVEDAHRSISIGVDGNGLIHVAWDHHNHPLNYARGPEPRSLELGPQQPMSGLDEQAVTYPEFFNLPDGDLLFMYRDGRSGSGRTMLNRWDTADQQWHAVQHPLIDGRGQCSPYPNQIAIDRYGVWHISWCWRRTSDVRTNHDLCYARSEDQGRTWTTSNGTAYTLPITPDNAEVIWAIPENSDLINTGTMATDSRGRPHIATYWRAPGENAPHYHIVWQDGEPWHVSRVGKRSLDFTLGGAGTRRLPIARPALAIDDRDRLFVLFRDTQRSDRVSVAISDDDARRHWRIKDLTSTSVGQWEPSFDHPLWQRTGRMHIFVQRCGQGDGETLEHVPPQVVSILEWQP